MYEIKEEKNGRLKQYVIELLAGWIVLPVIAVRAFTSFWPWWALFCENCAEKTMIIYYYRGALLLYLGAAALYVLATKGCNYPLWRRIFVLVMAYWVCVKLVMRGIIDF